MAPPILLDRYRPPHGIFVFGFAFLSAFCVAATRPVTRWNTTRSPVPLYSLFSRKRGTRVIHAHANARNVTFEPSLGAGKKASRLSEICQITFLDDPIKWLNGRTGIGTESRRAEGRDISISHEPFKQQHRRINICPFHVPSLPFLACAPRKRYRRR